MDRATRSNTAVERVEVSAYTVPTDSPESDGTLRWDSTTMVLVEARGGGERGLGYTYGDVAAGTLIESKLAEVVEGRDALSPQGSWAAMQHALRNAGKPGIGSMAMAAVDVALWDLKARLLGLPLADLLGRYREAVPVYGSGGFTSYTLARLREQLSGWAEEGIPRVKMKVGREPGKDPERVRAAREAVGSGVELMVDANAFASETLGAALRAAPCRRRPGRRPFAHCARRVRCPSRATRRPRSTRTPAARWRRSCTWSTSTTTRA